MDRPATTTCAASASTTTRSDTRPGWRFEEAPGGALAVTTRNGDVWISHPPRFGTDLDLLARRMSDHAGVVLEHALLTVRTGQEAEFERAFAQARSVIAGMPGFGRLTLSRCLERPSTYLLLVEWDRLEDHTVGFRGSVQYEQWRALLHSFYDPFPTVEHFEQVLGA
jgi:heme-degrading monooxygenase HmoA